MVEYKYECIKCWYIFFGRLKIIKIWYEKKIYRVISLGAKNWIACNFCMCKNLLYLKKKLKKEKGTYISLQVV